MITPFFRSSLLNTFSLCELRGFIEYSIGLRGGSNLSANIGSVVHGVLECLLVEKLSLQNSQQVVDHESFGQWKLDSRSTSDHLDVVYNYYDKESPGLFTDKSYSDCETLVNKALTFQNGSFHPWNNTAYAAEFQFETIIEDDWAGYTYNTPTGNVSGKLCLKGTIDAIYQEDSNTLHCVDYKTGKAVNDWASGKTKVITVKNKDKETSLYNDQQLMLYYYVLANTFPDKNIIMTLYFVRLDKAFTLVFDRKRDLPRIHNWIKERFEYIKSIDKPTWIDGTKDGWKCRFCPFNTNKQKGTNKTICKFYQSELTSKGYDKTMAENANFSIINKYMSGGSTKERQ